MASANPTAKAQWQISTDGGTTWSNLFAPTTENFDHAERARLCHL